MPEILSPYLKNRVIILPLTLKEKTKHFFKKLFESIFIKTRNCETRKASGLEEATKESLEVGGGGGVEGVLI